MIWDAHDGGVEATWWARLPTVPHVEAAPTGVCPALQPDPALPGYNPPEWDGCPNGCTAATETPGAMTFDAFDSSTPGNNSGAGTPGTPGFEPGTPGTPGFDYSSSLFRYICSSCCLAFAENEQFYWRGIRSTGQERYKLFSLLLASGQFSVSSLELEAAVEWWAGFCSNPEQPALPGYSFDFEPLLTLGSGLENVCYGAAGGVWFKV